MSETKAESPAFITLGNPVTQHFGAFIFGNATICDAVVEGGTAVGQHIVICGAGPSLADHIWDHVNEADQLWGCNSALPWLVAQGAMPTHGFCIDQTEQMCAEWASAPDVEYLVASTVHPHLTQYLASKGRRMRFFHNFVGIQERPVQGPDGGLVSYEDWLYAGLYPPTCRVGSGLNAVTRAIDVAMVMGAAKITVLGADCAIRTTAPLPKNLTAGSPEHLRWLREKTVMHADGGSALASGATSVTLVGHIDGREWHTKPDLIITAKSLVEMVRASEGRLVLVGDTLPNALMQKDADFLARLPGLTTVDGKPAAIKGRPVTGVEGEAIGIEVLNSTA